MLQQVADVPDGSEEAPLTFDSLVLKHAQFLNEMNKLQVIAFIFNVLLLSDISCFNN
jgi:hypothetical protein